MNAKRSRRSPKNRVEIVAVHILRVDVCAERRLANYVKCTERDRVCNTNRTDQSAMNEPERFAQTEPRAQTLTASHNLASFKRKY